MTRKDLKYIFGPVPSRRLGYSLGVDLVPFKTCSYDCIYCQLGKTTEKTVLRKEYTPLEEVLGELEQRLSENCIADYITLSGSGEPTLYSRLDELIRKIKQKTDIPVAVLTNGSLFWEKEVRDGLMKADLVIPSLDAGDEKMFRYVNRPCEEITFDKMVRGICDFRKKYAKPLWLEVMLLGGVTAMPKETGKIAALAEMIRPDKIQINAVSRPPAESFAYPVPKNRLIELCGCFKGPTEIIADYKEIRNNTYFKADKNEIIRLLKRRPCTIDDIASGLHIHRNEAIKHVEDLLNHGKVVTNMANHVLYYSVKKNNLK